MKHSSENNIREFSQTVRSRSCFKEWPTVFPEMLHIRVMLARRSAEYNDRTVYSDDEQNDDDQNVDLKYVLLWLPLTILRCRTPIIVHPRSSPSGKCRQITVHNEQVHEENGGWVIQPNVLIATGFRRWCKIGHNGKGGTSKSQQRDQNCSHPS